MAKFTYQGAYPRYYPTLSLFTKPGETHELDSAPDYQWVTDGATVSRETTKPAVTTPAEPVADELSAAEALLAANPALAHKLIEEAAQNA
jgi:hypothetical protein